MTTTDSYAQAELLSVAELAQRSGLSRAVIYRSVRSQKIPLVATKPRWLVPADCLSPLQDSCLWAGQVGALFGASQSAADDWADRGFIPCDKTPGGRRRFRNRDVVAAIRRCNIPLFTLDEAGYRLGLSRQQISELSNGGLPARVRISNGRFERTTIMSVAKAAGVPNTVYLTSTQVAKVFQTTRDNVPRLWFDVFQLPAIRLPSGQYLFPASDVERAFKRTGAIPDRRRAAYRRRGSTALRTGHQGEQIMKARYA